MPGSEDRTVTGWRQVSRFYRRPPGSGWLLSLAAIPLLLALTGQGLGDRAKLDLNGPNVSAPTVSVPGVDLPSVSFSPLSILRNGNVITLNGEVPDVGTRTGLLDTLKGIYGNAVQLVDNLSIKAGIPAPDLSGLASVFKAAVSMPDFKFKIVGDTVSLMGTAASDAIKNAVEAAAKLAWPNLKLSSNILVLSGATEAAPPQASPEKDSGDCGNLQADITAVMSTPVTFVTNGFTLSAGTQQQLTQVAEKLVGCHSAHVAVSGYTDNTGNDGINVPLSNSRAKSVADFLVAHGVPADSVTSKGFGSADPVASNATPDGRAQNRRVAITVS